jgi:predicted XRE-type DNA-binding protein
VDRPSGEFHRSRGHRLSHSFNQALTLETEIPRLFTQEKLSLSQIAEKLGTSRDRVRNILVRLKISRPKSAADSALTAWGPKVDNRHKSPLRPFNSLISLAIH